MVRLLGSIALGGVWAGFQVFVVLYHLLANWRSTQMGRHVMAFMTVCALIMDYVVVSLVLGFQPGRDWARFVLYGALAGVVWWRIALLIKEQRDSRRDARRDVQTRIDWQNEGEDTKWAS